MYYLTQLAQFGVDVAAWYFDVPDVASVAIRFGTLALAYWSFALVRGLTGRN